MNIIIVSAMFPPIRTGTSFYSKNLAVFFKKAGHKITVISTKNKQSGKDGYGVDVVRIPALFFPLKNYFKHLRMVSFIPSNYSKMYKLFKEKDPDLIILVNHYLDIAFPAIYAARRVNKPIWVSVGTQMQSLSQTRNKILNVLDRFICGNFIFPYCDRIIAWDREIERYINEIQHFKFKDKISIVLFGANGEDRFYDKEHKYDVHNQILGIGAVIDHRNFVFQIKVFSELLERFPKLKLKIIGHIYKDDAVKLSRQLGVSDNVVFMGEQPHEVVLKELNRSDVHWMMLDGEYKGLGTSNLEAMKMGVPIISNIPEDIFGFETMRDMKEYIYTDGISIAEIKDKISDLLRRAEIREKIGKNGRQFVEKTMNWECVVRKIENIFYDKK